MKNKITITILSLLVLTQLASAMSIDINTEPSFGLGDEISFSYTILSEISQEIEYVAVVSCPSAPLSLLKIKNASLEANVPFTEYYIYMSSVSNDVESQSCNASVGILNPKILEKKSFEIMTNPSFEFNIKLDKKIFVLNEDIYLDYTSGISDISTKAILSYPDGATKELSLPTLINAKQIGTYNLSVIASSMGYKDIVKEMQFGVIREDVVIPYSGVMGEDSAGSDEITKEKTRMEFPIFEIFMIILIVLFCGGFILILVYIIRKLLNKKKSKKKSKTR